jgi:hypothetical protein
MNISTIKIILDTNVPGGMISTLTRDFLYIPEEADEEKDKSEERNEKTSQYPFFTMDVEYPAGEIKELGRKESVDFFFNEGIFKRKLFGLTRASTDSDKHKNAHRNVMTMLGILFPTNLPIKSNIHDSFKEFIEHSPTPIPSSSIIPSFLQNLFSKSDDDQFSYLQIGGAKYTTIKVMWVNDIINHPEYRKLLDLGSRTWEWWNKGEKAKIEKKNNDDKTKIKKIIDEAEKKGILTKINSEYDDRLIERYPSSIQPFLREIRDKLKVLIAEGDINNIIKLISDISDYENEAARMSQRSSTSVIPYVLKKEPYNFEAMQKLAAKIKITDDVIAFFDSPHDYYELFEEKKEDEKSKEEIKNRNLKAEIQKYPRFMEFIKLAYSFVKPRKPSNPSLANMIKYYLKSGKGKKNNLAEEMNEVHEIYLGEDGVSRTNTLDIGKLEIGVDEIKISSSEKKKEDGSKQRDSTFEIYLQLDVVKGILDAKSMSTVKCLFRNSFSKKMYYALKRKNKHESEIDKASRLYLDIDVLKQESKKLETKQAQTNDPPVPEKKGGYRASRRRMKTRRKKDYFKYRKTLRK